MTPLPCPGQLVQHTRAVQFPLWKNTYTQEDSCVFTQAEGEGGFQCVIRASLFHAYCKMYPIKDTVLPPKRG